MESDDGRQRLSRGCWPLHLIMVEDHQMPALHRIDTHEKVCAERYGSINQQLITLHARLNSMSNRMWAAAMGTLGVIVMAFGVIAFSLFTKGH